MSKNLTRKGLAFGALVALGSSVFAGAPANALGLADNSFVSLAPTSGTAYTVVAGNGKTFSLTANEASTVAGGNFKFLVSDASETVEPTTATSARTGYSPADADTAAIASNVVTVTTATASTAGLAVGNLIKLEAGDITGVTAGAYKLTDVTSTTFKFAFTASDASNIAMGNGTAIEVLRETRNATNKTFVVNTGTNSASTNSTLVLQTTESTVVTRSVDVTAWVDSNGNDVLDSTEYASPTRTVTFKKASEITATTTIDPLIIGATSIVARVTTEPALNGQQMSNGDVTAMFTYQGSAIEFTPASSGAVYNAASGKWVVTATRSGSISAAGTPSGDVSQLTSTAHGLTNGEKVTIDGLAAAGGTTTGLNGTKTVTSAATNAFSIAAGGGTGSVTPTSATWTVQLVAGSYSARAKIGTDYLQAATSGTAVAVKAASGAASVAETANINSTYSSGAVSAAVRKGTLATSAKWTFKDADAAVIPADRLVQVTVTTVSTSAAFTGLKINGTAVAQGDVINLYTDAAGSVVADITATAVTADQAGDDLVLTAVAEGVSGTSKTATFNWTAGTNTLYDLNGTSSLVRNIAKGGSYTFNFAVTDTWSQYVSGDYRLNVVASGSSVSEVNYSIATGTASVTITDGELTTGDITVVATPQKKQIDGTWGTSGAPSPVTYTIKRGVQSGAAVSLTSADASVAFTTTAVAAGDSRTTQVDVTADGTAGTDAIEVTGVVTDALTGAVRPGAAVTVSGASDLLFVDGEKASIGSITVFADASGAYSVHIRSNKALFESVVTASAQGGTKTLKVTFEKAKADTATTATITAPATIESGKTIAVTVTLADKFGNPVVTDSAATGYVAGSTTPSLKVTYTGPGFVTSTIATASNADGQVKFTVLLGSTDAGAASVSVAYDSNGATDDVVGTTNVAKATAAVTVVDPVADAAAAKAAADAAAAKAAADAAAAAALVEAAAKAKTVTLTVPATTSQAGRALDVSVKVLNTAGAATAGRTVTFKSTGVGYLASTSAVTDANGVATVKLIAGNGDIGTSTVTATVDGVTSAASNVEFGVTDADVTVGGRAIYASVEFAKGKTVTVTIDGKRIYSKLQATDAYTELKFTQKTAGKHVVTIRVSGGTSVSETVVTTN